MYLFFAFILEYDSEDDEEEGVDVGGEIARGFPQAELSVEDPEAVSSLNVLSLSHSAVFSVDKSCKILLYSVIVLAIGNVCRLINTIINSQIAIKNIKTYLGFLVFISSMF